MKTIWREGSPARRELRLIAGIQPAHRQSIAGQPRTPAGPKATMRYDPATGTVIADRTLDANVDIPGWRSRGSAQQALTPPIAMVARRLHDSAAALVAKRLNAPRHSTTSSGNA